MRQQLPPSQILSCHSLNREGQGLADLPSGSRAAVWGLFPGEQARLAFRRRRQGFWVAEIEEIIVALPERREPLEDHYLDCSPWQVLGEAKQAELKLALARSFYQKYDLPEPIYRPAMMPLAYRTKMEFSLCVIDGHLRAAFHRRGQRWGLDTLDSCVLAHPSINRILPKLLSYLETSGQDLEVFQSLIIRASFAGGSLLATLFVSTEHWPEMSAPSDLQSWSVYYSDPRTPASTYGLLLAESGDHVLCDDIVGSSFRYSVKGFFQACPPAFGVLLDDLRATLPDSDALLDLYAGVGTIGLSLADKYGRLILSEYDEEAMRLAAENAEALGVANVALHPGPAEKQDLVELLSTVQTMVVDPPRSGLHPRVAKAIRDHGPADLAYVSCNPFTQAQDLEIISETYQIEKCFFYDFYAQTPHLESLLVMKRKS